MSFAQYAKHRGVSKTAVSQAVKQGRITVKVDPRTAERYLESQRADVEWEKNSDQSKNVNGGANGKRPPKKPAKGARVEEGDRNGIPSLYDSRAIKEAYLARKAKVEYERLIGKLVPIDEVQAQAMEAGIALKSTIVSIPDRLAPMLAAETDPDVVHAMLLDELTKALEELARLELKVD